MKEANSSARATSLIHPFLDFWLLGGASVAIWMLMQLSGFVRESNTPLDQRFLQIGAAFSLLSLVCNYPHFMISYQLGYGRGVKFVRQNWFALILVPALLIALFAWAYVTVDSGAAAGSIVSGANDSFDFLGVGFRLGLQDSLGRELMGLGTWIMYFTVGWHYSKQIYGCMMTYSRFDSYVVNARQRSLIKASVFSIALLQFTFLFRIQQSERGLNLGLFPGTQTQLTPLELPEGLYRTAIVTTVLLSTATIGFVFIGNFLRTRRWPSANFLIPWIAFHVWWIPAFQIPEFNFMMVPFFHSLQYLPFAYRAGTPQFNRNRWYYAKISAHAAIILAIGFFAFEGIPATLDRILETGVNQRPLFFITAFAIFINVHHFFIDSVSWKFKDAGLKAAIFQRPNLTEVTALNASSSAAESENPSVTSAS